MFVMHLLISFFLWITLWIPFYILGFLVGWIGLLFCNKDSEHLPKLWWPWDNSHGINGTLGGNNPKWVYLCNPELQDESVPLSIRQQKMQFIIDNKTGKERTFIKRWIWLYWRNPVSNLSLWWIGAKIPMVNGEYVKTENTYYRVFFNRLTIGCYRCGKLWCYNFMFQYSDKKAFYHVVGWKLLDITTDVEGGHRARFMYRISPLYSR